MPGAPDCVPCRSGLSPTFGRNLAPLVRMGRSRFYVVAFFRPVRLMVPEIRPQVLLLSHSAGLSFEACISKTTRYNVYRRDHMSRASFFYVKTLKRWIWKFSVVSYFFVPMLHAHKKSYIFFFVLWQDLGICLVIGKSVILLKIFIFPVISFFPNSTFVWYSPCNNIWRHLIYDVSPINARVYENLWDSPFRQILRI